MKKILCATRGGEASRRTQEAVIVLAQEEEASILFLFAVDVDFLERTARGVRPDVVMEQMEQMGEFLLAIACERAAKQGVEAGMVVRRGSLVDAIKATANEEGADCVAFGRPAGPDSAFSLAELQRLAIKIEADAGVETRIV